jgi:hypothetical protein
LTKRENVCLRSRDPTSEDVCDAATDTCGI